MRVTGLLLTVSIMLLVNRAHGGFSWRGGSSSKSNPPSRGSKASYVGDSGYRQPVMANLANSTDSKSSGRTSRSVGISAWGIIGVIVGAISLTTLVYYSFALYPHICKKQRSYDIMELSDVV